MARRGTRIEVGYEHEGVDLRVVCEVGPAQREVRWGDGACPADPGEVEIVAVYEDDGEGTERPELIEVLSAREPFARIEEQAHEAANEADRDAEYEAAERRSDEARESRRGW